MEFHYPKEVVPNRSHLQRNSRPQPSPSKSEQLFKDLGLDYDDILTDSSISSSEDELLGSKPTAIEYRVLNKELAASTELCNRLKEEKRELENSLNQLKHRYKKESASKNTRLKILHRAYRDNMNDKHALIMDLQRLIEEDGNTDTLKMITNIQDLHEQKEKLHQELLAVQEDYEEKLMKMESGISVEMTADTATIQALEKATEEKVKLSLEVEELKKDHKEQLTAYEDILKEKDSELIRANQEKEKKSRSYNNIKIKLETLRREVEESKQSNNEKECELETLVKNLKSEIDRTRKDKELVETQMRTLEADMTSRLKSEMALTQSGGKLHEENRELLKDVDRYKMRILALEEETSSLEATRREKEKLTSENKELNEELRRMGVEFENHKVSWKEKLTFAEQEREEAHVLLQQHRRKMMSDMKEMKMLSEKKEDQLNREMEESNDAYLALKKSSEQSLQRMEEKLTSSKAKRKELESRVSELTKESNMKSTEISNLQAHNQLDNAEKENLTSLLKDKEDALAKEQTRADHLSAALRRMTVEKESLDRQIAVKSGESDSVIAQMEKKSRDLHLSLSTAEERLLVKEREHDVMVHRIEELDLKISQLTKSHHDTLSYHKVEIERMSDAHKRENMKLKASAAIATESANSRSAALESVLRLATSTLRQLSRDKALLRREVEKFPALLKDSIKRAAKQVADAVEEISETNKDLVRRYRKEMTLRKKYHNELVELRGNIRVFVRARPLISEDGNNAKIALSYDDSDDAVVYVNNPQKGRSQTFELDRVFQGGSTQEQVYAEVQALVTSCMDGYHVCIFAYGQTGSGKTYTMEGTNEDPGINQRALDDLFHMIEDRSCDWDYKVVVSLVEIYNETLRDLLNARQEKLEIKMNSDGSLFVQRLKQLQVKDLNDVNNLFRTGRSNRSTASTNMNERSSRSHAVLIVTVEGVNKTTGTTTTGRLNLIDLAGSERVSKSGASGDRLKEAQNINRSLSALGDVIHALRNKQGHVPFRNSKLTYLLQDSLSKESKTLMMVQVSPIVNSIGETVCSLNFAQRVRAVELGQATRKVKSAA